MSTAGGVNIYECVSLLAPECAVCLSVCVCVCVCVCLCVLMCVRYQIRVPAENHMCQASVNLTP